jgi:hypothetical protein
MKFQKVQRRASLKSLTLRKASGIVEGHGRKLSQVYFNAKPPGGLKPPGGYKISPSRKL